MMTLGNGSGFGSLAGAGPQTDDVLGLWGDPAVTGKPAGADLTARKKSHPVAVALAADVTRTEEAVTSRLRELYAMALPWTPSRGAPGQQARCALLPNGWTRGLLLGGSLQVGRGATSPTDSYPAAGEDRAGARPRSSPPRRPCRPQTAPCTPPGRRPRSRPWPPCCCTGPRAARWMGDRPDRNVPARGSRLGRPRPHPRRRQPPDRRIGDLDLYRDKLTVHGTGGQVLVVCSSA